MGVTLLDIDREAAIENPPVEALRQFFRRVFVAVIDEGAMAGEARRKRQGVPVIRHIEIGIDAGCGARQSLENRPPPINRLRDGR